MFCSSIYNQKSKCVQWKGWSDGTSCKLIDLVRKVSTQEVALRSRRLLNQEKRMWKNNEQENKLKAFLQYKDNTLTLISTSQCFWIYHFQNENSFHFWESFFGSIEMVWFGLVCVSIVQYEFNSLLSWSNDLHEINKKLEIKSQNQK